MPKVPTINSVFIPTKNLLESQVVLNAASIQDSNKFEGVRNQGSTYSDEVRHDDHHLANPEDLERKTRSQFYSPAQISAKSDSKRDYKDNKQDVIIKEIHNYSKSLVTVEDFGEEDRLKRSNVIESKESSVIQGYGRNDSEYEKEEEKESKSMIEEKKEEKSSERRRITEKLKETLGIRNEEERKEDRNREYEKPKQLHVSEESSSLPVGVQTPLGETGKTLKRKFLFIFVIEKILLQKTVELTHRYQAVKSYLIIN